MDVDSNNIAVTPPKLEDNRRGANRRIVCQLQPAYLKFPFIVNKYLTNESNDAIIESNDRGATESGEHRQTQRMNLPAQDRRWGTGKNTTGKNQENKR